MDIAKIRRKLKETGQGKGTDSLVVAGAKKGPSIVEAEDQREDHDVHPVPTEGSGELTYIEEGSEIVELLVFSLYNEEYAFKIQKLEEIIRPQHITNIPRTPHYLIGVTSLRGKIIPIIDLRKMLSLTGKEESRKQKIIILKGPKGPLGVMVDRISGVIRLPVSGLTASPPHLDESQLRYIEQVAILNNRFISIINTEEITNIM